MTKNDTQRPQTAAGAPHRNRAMRYAAIAAAVLVVAVSTILLVTRPNDPPPADYHVAVTGNISATWVSDNSDGTLDLTNGGNSEKIRAGSLTLTVQSTLPSGASCTIVDSNANIIDTKDAIPTRGASGKDALTTVTCSTTKS
ncbi:hypothetical protein [Amycolatopsis sp. NBC_01286]|uniref:hypothetical protein n=1 Tax=Amycolatopsis sp. NBC_01286 TaxID=2903560 RepID=UPI002E0DD1AB|nr:hypothetical protein OG570_28660 [Amycolatopsis sp. NBC_01286]